MKYIDLIADKNFRKEIYKNNVALSNFDEAFINLTLNKTNVIFNVSSREIINGIILSIVHSIKLHTDSLQKIIIVDTHSSAEKIKELLDKYRPDVKSKIIDQQTKNRDIHKGKKLINNQIIIGTPGIILDFLSSNLKNALLLRELLFINLDSLMTQGYLDDLKKIVQLTKDKQLIFTSDKITKVIRKFLDEDLPECKEVILTNKKLKNKRKPKFKVLKRYLTNFRDKNILIIVKSHKELELIKAYFMKKGYEIALNFDTIIDFKYRNLIVLIDEENFLEINKDHLENKFDIIINYNIKDLYKKFFGTEDKASSKDSGKIDEGIKKIIVSGAQQINKTKKVYQNLRNKAKTSSNSKLREKLFDAILPSEEVNLEDKED